MCDQTDQGAASNSGCGRGRTDSYKPMERGLQEVLMETHGFSVVKSSAWV